MDTDFLKEYLDKKIAVYGLSTETERFLQQYGRKYQIIGLLDGFKENGTQFGYPIISMNAAIAEGVSLILVIARPGSCRIIAKRIGEVCKKNNISLIDIRGKNLNSDKEVVFEFPGIQDAMRAKLEKAIRDADAVSFDLFDTVIVREVPGQEDIFRLVDDQLRKKGIIIPDFVNVRIKTEKEMSYNCAPYLTDIYSSILKQYDCRENTAEQLSDLEFNTDLQTIVPRKSMVDLYNQTINDGKEVYIISDTYYTENQIKQILKKCGILNPAKLYLSDGFHTGKTGRLFQIYKRDQSGNGNLLHIGDDLCANIKYASENQIHSFQICSKNDLFDMAGGLGLEDHIHSLSDSVKVGLLLSHLFNDPFQFDQSSAKKIQIRDSYDVGYLFAGPMIFDFALWYTRQLREKKYANSLLCARDGYLIKKILNLIDPDDPSIYFLTSRVAAIRAGVQSERDIAYVDSMRFDGSIREKLKVRFGLEIDEGDNADTGMQQECSLVKYSKEILKSADSQKKNYLKYVQTLKLKDGPIALFDFVSKGTTQLFLRNIFSDHEIHGFYFMQLEPEYMAKYGMHIEPFVSGNAKKQNPLLENYNILETILTSPDPSLLGFDSTGKPVFDKEVRKERDIACILNMQKGVEDYCRDYLRLIPLNEAAINKDLDGAILNLIHKVEIKDDIFNDMVIEDKFCNRYTKVFEEL